MKLDFYFDNTMVSLVLNLIVKFVILCRFPHNITELFQAELDQLQELYSFKLTSVNNQPYFYIKFDNGEERNLRPEDIGAGNCRLVNEFSGFFPGILVKSFQICNNKSIPCNVNIKTSSLVRDRS